MLAARKDCRVLREHEPAQFRIGSVARERLRIFDLKLRALRREDRLPKGVSSFDVSIPANHREALASFSFWHSSKSNSHVFHNPYHWQELPNRVPARFLKWTRAGFIEGKTVGSKVQIVARYFGHCVSCAVFKKA